MAPPAPDDRASSGRIAWLSSVAFTWLVAAALSLLVATRASDWDFWWHLATGRWIAAHHAVPRVDPFSYTVPGAPWHDVNWLSDVALYGAYSLGGGAGIVTLKVLAAVGTFGSLGLSLRELSVSRTSHAATLVAAAVLVQPRLSLDRPATYGATCLSVAIFVASRAYVRRDRSSLALLPLVLVWHCVHPSALLGVGVASVLALSLLAARAGRRAVGAALVALAGTVAILVASPQGRDILLHARGYGADSWVVRLTDEWRPTTLREPLLWVPLAFGSFGLVAVARREAAPLLLGLLAVGALPAASYLRHLPYAVVLATPAVAVALDAVAGAVAQRRLSLVARVIPLALALAVPLGQLTIFGQVLLGHPGFGLDEHECPGATLELLRRLPAGRVVNEFGLGGYLIWKDVPGGVFFDGRTVQVYDEEEIRDLYYPILTSHHGLDGVADRFGAKYGLVASRGVEAAIMMTHPGWVPLLHDRATSLFVRRAALPAVVAIGVKPSRLRWIDDAGFLDGYYAPLLADPAERDGLLDELRRLLADPEPAAVAFDVVRFLATKDPAYVDLVRPGTATR